MRNKGKLTEEDNDKNSSKTGDVRGNNFSNKGFVIGKQSVSFCSSVNSVDLVNI